MIVMFGFLKKWVRENWIFLVVALVGLVVYLLISITKHLQFGSTGYDLVIFDQAVRNYSEFNAPASSFRGFENLLGDHFHPILALLAPLYWVLNSPISLLVAQAVLLVSAALPVYLYAKKRFSLAPAVFAAIAFILSPLLIRTVFFDFHEIAFAVPLIAWAIYLIDIKRFGWLYLPLLSLLLVKENLSLLVATFGLYLIIQKKYLHGTVFLLTGIVWFFLATKVFIPYFAGSDGGFNYWTYDALGPGLVSAGLTIITNPVLFLTVLLTPLVKILTFIKTFGVFLGFTFLSPVVLLSAPILLERFLSSNQNYWQFDYHYGAVLAPILVMAAVDGLYRVLSWKWFKKHTKKLSVIITGLFALIALVIFVATPMNFILKPSSYIVSSETKAGYEIMKQIPPSESVCTTNRIAPHLGKNDLTLIGFEGKAPQTLDCTFILTASHLDQSTTLADTLGAAEAQGYAVVDELEGWVLYKKAGE